MVLLATLCLFIGSAGLFLVPLYIGWAIDAITRDDYDEIKNLVWQMAIIILVISSLFNL